MSYLKRWLDDTSLEKLEELLREEEEFVEKLRDSGEWEGDKINKDLPYTINPLSSYYLRRRTGFEQLLSSGKEIRFGAAIHGFVPIVLEDDVRIEPVTLTCKTAVTQLKRKRLLFTSNLVLDEIYHSNGSPVCVRENTLLGVQVHIMLSFIHGRRINEYRRRLRGRLLQYH